MHLVNFLWIDLNVEFILISRLFFSFQGAKVNFFDNQSFVPTN